MCIKESGLIIALEYGGELTLSNKLLALSLVDFGPFTSILFARVGEVKVSIAMAKRLDSVTDRMEAPGSRVGKG